MNPAIPPGPREVYTLADLRDWPTAAAGREPALRLSVFGDPVAHSASPPMHNAALAACGLNLRYTRLHIRPDELAEALRLLTPCGFVGTNLTIPHKTAALPLLDHIDPQAAELGAVNTVRVEPDGILRGFNTDGPGMVRALREEFGAELRGLRVLLLGAGGGAGRALAVQCALEACGRLRLANRTFDKAQALAAELRARFPADAANIEAVPWEPASLAGAAQETDLVINASALGLKTDDPSPLPAEALSPRVLVFDTVYRPGGAPTPLLQAARQAGATSTGGLSLLLHQGVLSFEHWFNRPAPVEAMRRALEDR
jgi:shikimate dehydrogenase